MAIAKKPAPSAAKKDSKLKFFAELAHAKSVDDSHVLKEALKASLGLPISISGVEGIPGQLDLVLRDGMNLLTGQNEDGKTSATRAVVVATGGEIGRPLRANDTVERGSVRGLGVVLNVGGRTTRAGSPSVELADYGTLGELIEPAGKTAATRDKRRVDILMDYVTGAVTPELLLEMAGGDTEIAGGVQGKKGEELTLRASMAAVKKMAEAVARDYEARVKVSQELERSNLKILDDLKKEVAGYKRPEGGLSGAQRRHEEAIRRHESLTRAREIRVAQETERARWGDIGECPDAEALRTEWMTVSEEVSTLKGRLYALEERLGAIEREGTARRIQIDQWTAKRDALAQPIAGPTADEVTAASAKLIETKGDVEAAEMYDAIDHAQETVEQQRAAAKIAQREADKRRAIARGVGAVVNRVIQASDLHGLALDESDAHDADEEDGKGENRWRLCRIDPDTGALEPFERLSLGARTRLVLTGIGCRKYPGRVMPVEPGFWYALSPKNQRELVAVAVAEKIKLISEIPTDAHGVGCVHLGTEWVNGGTETAEAYVLRTLRQGNA